MIPPGSLTLQEVADLLHVSPDNVHAALQAGRLPGLKAGHQWFIERRALTPHVVALLQQRECQRVSRHAKTPSHTRTHRGRR